jgi:tripartite-type tricarboxylate transporter receptor subunit TctC
MSSFIAKLGAGLCIGVTSLFSLGANAAYPEKPIRVILPYPPGGGGDLLIRAIQPMLEKRLGQPIVVDYKTGAAGNIGAQEVVNAPPDGYTLLLGATNNFVINQYLFPKMGFDPATALAPVTVLIDQPYVLVISSKVPAQTFAEFAAHAKTQTGKLNFASPGSGTVPHMSALMLSDQLGAKMVHVPYRGSQPAVMAVVGNEVQLFLASYGIIAGQIAEGKMRPIVVAADKRLPLLPNVQTAAEAGVPPGILLGNWWGLAAPKGTDRAILQRLAREVKAVMDDPEIQKKFVTQGSVPVGSTPEEFSSRIQVESGQWKNIVEKTGVKIE